MRGQYSPDESISLSGQVQDIQSDAVSRECHLKN